MTDQPGDEARRRPWLPALVAVVMTVCVTAIAGYVLDGAGQFAFGFWASVWGLGTALLGIVVVSAMRRMAALRRVAAALLALFCAAVGAGLLSFTGPGRVPMLSPEGLWMYPLAISLVGAALAAAWYAVVRRP